MFSLIFSFVAPLLAPIASHFVDAWLRKNIRDRELLAAWSKMMEQLQSKSWLKGSTPTQYREAGKDQPPEEVAPASEDTKVP